MRQLSVGYVIIPDMAGAQTFVLAEPLSFDLPCRSSTDTRDDEWHEITIDTDWSVSTGHDLEAERVAAAFGSRTSCLDLDLSIAAARVAITFGLRRKAYPLRPVRCGGRRHWEVDGMPDIHRPWRFASAITAASYIRSAAYVAEKHHALLWQVDELVHRFICAGHGQAAPPKWTRNGQLVSDPDGLNRLWDAGIHPDDLPAIRNLIGHMQGPLPATTYIEIAYADIAPVEYQRMLELTDLDTVLACIGDGVRTAEHLSHRLNETPGDQP